MARNLRKDARGPNVVVVRSSFNPFRRESAMRRTFLAMIVAAAPMVVAAWACPAGAEPWDCHHHVHHGGYWHHAWPRPSYSNYGPVVVVSVCPTYSLTGLPMTVRAVRLHEDDRPDRDVVARKAVNANNEEPPTESSATSSRANSEPMPGTTPSSLDEPLRAFVRWLFPPLSLWASL